MSTVVVLLLVQFGCAPPPPYLRGYRFGPEPALAVMFKPSTQTPAISVLSSVVGIRRGNSESSVPPAVEIRMRIENSGQATASLDPQTLVLVNGALQSFAMPEVHPPKTVDVQAGQTQTISVFFPFLPGTSPQTMPLNAIRLRWQITLEGKSYLQTVVFERASPLYYE